MGVGHAQGHARARAVISFTSILYIIKPTMKFSLNPLNAELNPICHLLALLGAHHILHVSRLRVNYVFA
jgi:hypothetical protein